MDFLTDIAISVSFAVYEIYATLAIFLTKAFPGLTKRIGSIIAQRLFGITLNGPEKTDIQVLKPDKFYSSFVAYFLYGMYDGYLNEEWTVADLTALAVKLTQQRHFWYFAHPLRHVLVLFNLQTRKKAWEVGTNHYDIGNDLYEAMLDDNMQYTCGYWREATNLNDAQVAKMDLIARKLYLKPGMRVLDIGCGFGTLGCYLARNYGVSVVGCTISKEQMKYGLKRCEGLPVELRLCDYREMDEKFDRVVSVGMFEHVGPKNYDTFLGVVHRCLKEDGIFLLQTIGNNDPKIQSFDMWVHKYIFPNSQLPSAVDIAKKTGHQWLIEDWHNFSFDYSKTLAAWKQNFERAWPQLQTKYGDRFYRMWILYLTAAQALFLTRSYQLWQIVMRKHGMKNGYVSVR